MPRCKIIKVDPETPLTSIGLSDNVIGLLARVGVLTVGQALTRWTGVVLEAPGHYRSDDIPQALYTIPSTPATYMSMIGDHYAREVAKALTRYFRTGKTYHGPGPLDPSPETIQRQCDEFRAGWPAHRWSTYESAPVSFDITPVQLAPHHRSSE